MSGVSPGTQLHAPEGFHNLEKGVTYYFLRSSSVTGRVLLIEYRQSPMKAVVHKSKKRPRRKITPSPFPILIVLHRTTFEPGIKGGKIKKTKQQIKLPPWLAKLEGLNLAVVDQLRTKAKRKHGDRIDDKLACIYPLLKRLNEILEADDPDRLINDYARSLVPRQNETRMRLWFYTYIVFSQNRFSLHYPIHRIGHWNRMRKSSAVKRGRPGWRGKEFGYNTDAEMKKKIIAGYSRECGLGIEMQDIVIAILSKDFGCKTRDAKRGKRTFREVYHPEGKPFPQPGAIEYFIRQEFGTPTVALTLLGRVRARSTINPPRGAFTEGTCNLMQRVVGDAYAVKELARGLIEGSPLPPLHVAERRDTASGMKTGIGFSQGGESTFAYRMACFCEAIGKVTFCRLFGVKITPREWPSQGVSPAEFTDRGAGARAGATAHTDEFKPSIKGAAPAYSAQSDADIEAAHPKNRHNAEAPSFIQSNLRTFELIRREIFKLLKFNRSADIRDRVPPDIADCLAGETPIDLWNELALRGRNDAVLMTFDDAVRSFLAKREAVLTADGVVLHGQLYKSASLDESGARASRVGCGGLPIEVYFLEGCIRHIWLDWERHLIEVDLTFPVPVENSVFYMSLAELIQFEAFCKERVPQHAENRTALGLLTYQEFQDQTGQKMNSGRRIPGRAKRGSRVAKQEAAEARAAVTGKKAK